MCRNELIKELLRLVDSGNLKEKEKIIIKFKDGSQLLVWFEDKKEVILKLVKI